MNREMLAIAHQVSATVVRRSQTCVTAVSDGLEFKNHYETSKFKNKEEEEHDDGLRLNCGDGRLLGDGRRHGGRASNG